MTAVELPAEIIRDVMRMACESKYEICGLITNDYEIYPIRNVSGYPESSFVFDKHQYFDTITQLCSADRGVLCVYHSHPYSTPEPSKEDLRFARRCSYNMLIVSPKGYRWIENAT